MKLIAQWLQILQQARKELPFIDSRARRCYSLHDYFLEIDTPKDAVDLLRILRERGWFIPPEEDLRIAILGENDFSAGLIASQIPDIVNLLQQKPHTRRALLQLSDYGGYDDDFMSVLVSAVLRQENNSLVLSVHARSVDLYLAFPIILYQMHVLLSYIAKQVRIPAGKITFFMNSAHSFEDYDAELQFLSHRYANLKKES